MGSTNYHHRARNERVYTFGDQVVSSALRMLPAITHGDHLIFGYELTLIVYRPVDTYIDLATYQNV